jgi:hypothetical protein
MPSMPSGVPKPRPDRPLRNSLDGPSRTITVEPVQVPVTAPEPLTSPERERDDDRPPAPREPAQPAR